MASEQFSLCWDNFHKNMSSGMNSLLESECLVDVTLAVEGRHLKAHKMVLSVCSPYFKELFKSNPCKHPIVFMKDVSYEALRDLLQFMYQGEVQVSQENLTTFIKTAEALQIKGLTGDGNGSADDTGESVQDRTPSEPTPIQVPRPKKIAPPPISTPPVKRQRVSSSFDSTPSQPIHTPPIQTKTEPISNTNTDQIIQFKMEPHDQPTTINLQDDNPDDTFDEPLDDTNVDDTEEYSMMEGNEEEPQAGTSTETAGEGQEETGAIPGGLRKVPRIGVVVDGFTYHQNTFGKNKNVRYFVCSEYKRLVCRARAVLPADGSVEDLVLRKGHNHPPLHSASVRDLFIRELKAALYSNPLRPLKNLHEDVAIMYPEGGALCPFSKVAASMRRWRQAVSKDFTLL